LFEKDANSSCFVEITEEITVYRYSQERTLEYLRVKVARLSEPKTLEISKSITRSLAKDGLMEDGNEELLKGNIGSVVLEIFFLMFRSWTTQGCM
jgi:hypothetical protein